VLTKKEIEVLKLRKQNLTQIEVAKRLHISQAAVSVFETKAISKIKEAQKVVQFSKKMKFKPNN